MTVSARERSAENSRLFGLKWDEIIHRFHRNRTFHGKLSSTAEGRLSHKVSYSEKMILSRTDDLLWTKFYYGMASGCKTPENVTCECTFHFHPCFLKSLFYLWCLLLNITLHIHWFVKLTQLSDWHRIQCIDVLNTVVHSEERNYTV